MCTHSPSYPSAQTDEQGWYLLSEVSTMCTHSPSCPSAKAGEAWRAQIVCRHDEQGWHLLCNGVILFDDGGAILPDGSTAGAWSSRRAA